MQDWEHTSNMGAMKWFEELCKDIDKSDLITPFSDQASEEFLQQILYCF